MFQTVPHSGLKKVESPAYCPPNEAVYMTRLPLTSFLRNTGFYRPVILSNNCRRYLSEVSSQLSKAGPHDASHTAPHSSKPKEGSDPDASAPTTLADEQPAKKKRKRTIKTVVAEGTPTLTTLTGGQINKDPKPKKEKKKETEKEKEKEAKRGKASLRPGEVLPEVPAGELPPIDLWRKYFLTEKASSQRCVVRKPETAAMLADIFVPEGSKDKIIIEASPGVYIPPNFVSSSSIYGCRSWTTHPRAS